jgi:hypothetical protein
LTITELKKLRAEIIGGLGNQLFSYFGAMSHAIHFQKSLEVNYAHINESFEDKSNCISELLLPGKSIRTGKLLDFLRPQSKHKYCSTEVGFDQEVYRLPNLRIIQGYFQSYKYFDHFMMNFPSWKPIIINPTSTFLSSFDTATAEKPVMIHVRRGDYRNLKDSHGLVGMKYYLSVLNEIYPTIAHREIWVFGDERQELFRLESEILQMGLKCKIISFKETMSDLENLVLMSKGSINIIGNSTFAWWGARFNQGDSKVYCPDKWFKGMADPCDLIPPTWNRRQTYWEEL